MASSPLRQPDWRFVRVDDVLGWIGVGGATARGDLDRNEPVPVRLSGYSADTPEQIPLARGIGNLQRFDLIRRDIRPFSDSDARAGESQFLSDLLFAACSLKEGNRCQNGQTDCARH